MARDLLTGKPVTPEIRRVMSDGIDWYVEQRGAGAEIVLIPSGEGDCRSFAVVAGDLAQDFRVTTFDTPGYSRSRVTDRGYISVNKLGGQIESLLATLRIKQAIVFGCSSGGLAALDIAIAGSDLVRHTVVHEVALPDRSGRDGPLHQMATLDDAGIAKACEGFFADFFNEDRDAWTALGDEFHQRIAVNYPIWVREYVMKLAEHAIIDPASLRNRPITWTIGALFPVQVFFSNVQLSHRAGIEIATLPCRHFPQVSIPGALAAHIRGVAAQ